MEGRKNTLDIIIAGALIAILGVLVVPVPPVMLDLFLVLSMGLAVLVLVMTMQLRDTLQFSSFPSLLLILTLFRLALNVATTRQILLNGYAGNVIQAFGDFVVGGNYIVGVVVFLILVVINFMVITKGSGRVAEVAARFTLDSMPGKQMSIDADLNAGIIDEAKAIARREKLTREADFYGAMDGASKFVRGDAIAGLIIIVINIIGGFSIGMLQQGMTALEAIRRYTILTVGDGLVTQIPALIISTTAGALVTRAASSDTIGTEISRQVFFKSKPLMLTGVILLAISLVPGLPFVPFLALGGTLGGLGLIVKQKKLEQPEEETKKTAPELAKRQGAKALPSAKDDKQVPGISPIDLEIGFGLVPLVDNKQGGKLIERIGMARKQIAEELGFVLPQVNVRDNITLKNNEYCIKIRGLEIARGTVRPGMSLAINSGGKEKLEGFQPVTEPTFGFEAYWIPEDKIPLAESKKMTVVDASSVVTTHLAEEAKRHAAQILSRQNVSNMVDTLKETNPSVVQELIPAKFTIGGIHRVLQRLLEEKVPIRDLALILETISDHVEQTQDRDILAEFCRQALGGHICQRHMTEDGTLPAIAIHPDLEKFLKKTIHREGKDLGSLLIDPAVAHEIIESIQKTVKLLTEKGLNQLLLCSAIIRPHLKHLIQHKFKDISVISFSEVPSSAQVDMRGIVPVPKGIKLDEPPKKTQEAA